MRFFQSFILKYKILATDKNFCVKRMRDLIYKILKYIPYTLLFIDLNT